METEKIVQQVVGEVLGKVLKSEKSSGHKCTCNLKLETAEKLIKAVENKAKEMNLSVVIAVVNKGGNPVAIHAMDNSYIASFDVALNKAYTSVALKMPTKNLETLAAPGGELYGIQNTNNNRLVIFGGGEVLEVNGKIIGGLGVSGSNLKNDTYLGEYGKKFFEEM